MPSILFFDVPPSTISSVRSSCSCYPSSGTSDLQSNFHHFSLADCHWSKWRLSDVKLSFGANTLRHDGVGLRMTSLVQPRLNPLSTGVKIFAFLLMVAVCSSVGRKPRTLVILLPLSLKKRCLMCNIAFRKWLAIALVPSVSLSSTLPPIMAAEVLHVCRAPRVVLRQGGILLNLVSYPRV